MLGGEKGKMGFMRRKTSNQLKKYGQQGDTRACARALWQHQVERTTGEAVCYRKEADKDKTCQQPEERGRKTPLFRIEFIYVPENLPCLG